MLYWPVTSFLWDLCLPRRSPWLPGDPAKARHGQGIDQDLARCALYLADVGVVVGVLVVEPTAWAWFSWGLVNDLP
jgi:hypothetical protein